ncbi:MAG: hypothetical protein ACK5OB_18405 [Pirellula sp.]
MIMHGVAKTVAIVLAFGLSMANCHGFEFQWPKEVLNGWQKHKQFLNNGTFYLEQASDNGIRNEKTVYCRNGDQLIEEKGPDGIRVSVFRSGSYFVVSKLKDATHWDLRQLSPTPENRIVLSPYLYFPYAFFATEFSNDNTREYFAESPFHSGESFKVGWRSRSNPDIHGTLVFDPKVSWGCTELRYVNQDSVEAKLIAEYDSGMLKSVRIEDPKSPETFSLVRAFSDAAPAEMFRLEHYGLSEDLLGGTPEQTRDYSMLVFGAIGVVLLVVSFWIKKSGVLKGS